MRMCNRALVAACGVVAAIICTAAAFYPEPQEKGVAEAAAPLATASSLMPVVAQAVVYAPDKPLPSVVAPEPTTEYYDAPLTHDLQDFVFEECEARDVPNAAVMVLAIIEQESRGQSDAVSGTGDYGLMQINSGNHKWLAEALGFSVPAGHDISEAFLDPEQNIRAGIYILADLYGKYDDPHKILMSYNMGPAGASRLWDDGVTTSRYSREVVERMAALEGGPM